MGARIIFGGSFNPLHCGHMRLAIEALELMRGIADVLEFMPSAKPPHKKRAPMLPFGLRVDIIRAAIKPWDAMRCLAIEAGREGPSYTCDTMSLLASEYGAENLYFLMGSQDYKLLPEWRNGLKLPSLCNLVVAPRGQYSQELFESDTRALWPDCGAPSTWRLSGCPASLGMRIPLAAGASCWLPAPYLDISATHIRRLWLCGRDITFLAPSEAIKILTDNQQAARASWRE